MFKENTMGFSPKYNEFASNPKMRFTNLLPLPIPRIIVLPVILNLKDKFEVILRIFIDRKVNVSQYFYQY